MFLSTRICIKDDRTKPTLSGINCCCEGARVRNSKAQCREQKLSTRRARGRREAREHVGSDEQKLNTRRARGRREEHVSSDVTRIPSEADHANRSSILDVEQSNSFAALEEMVDDAEAKSSASVTYTCAKDHCTGGHFQGKHAKRDYAKHIEIKHRGNLAESESKLGLLQCKTCGKITYTGAKAAKKHQDGCAAQPPEVQAEGRKRIENPKSHSVGAAAASKGRKWQPHFSKRMYTRREVDLTDTITDAHIDAFFGGVGNYVPPSFFTKLESPFEKLLIAAGAMVGIIDLIGQCKLLGAEERDSQQWYKCTSARLRDASTSIKALLASPYFAYMNNPRTAEIYSTLG